MKSNLPTERKIRYEQIMELRKEGKHICGFLREVRAGIVGHCALTLEMCEDGLFNNMEDIVNCPVYRRIMIDKDYS